MCKMADEDAKRIIAGQAVPSVQNVSEEELQDTLFNSIENANTNIKRASYYFIEDRLTEIESNRSLKDMFKHNLKSW